MNQGQKMPKPPIAHIPGLPLAKALASDNCLIILVEDEPNVGKIKKYITMQFPTRFLLCPAPIVQALVAEMPEELTEFVQADVDGMSVKGIMHLEPEHVLGHSDLTPGSYFYFAYTHGGTIDIVMYMVHQLGEPASSLDMGEIQAYVENCLNEFNAKVPPTAEELANPDIEQQEQMALNMHTADFINYLISYSEQNDRKLFLSTTSPVLAALFFPAFTEEPELVQMVHFVASEEE